MAEEYHKLTEEQKRMLFLNKAQRDVLKAEEERIAARHRFAGIVFVYFLVDWTLREIKSVIMRIAAMEHISAMYIGITESPCWRWRLCDGYKVPGTEDDDEEYDGMKAHARLYDNMYVVTVEWKDPACIMEELAIEFLRGSEYGHKCKNARVYRTGPVKDGGKYFIYICTVGKLLDETP